MEHSWFLPLLAVLCLLHSASAKTINNSLKEKPTVKCGPERVEISAQTESNFEGVLFIKNWRYTEGCFTAYEKGSNATKQPTFSLALKDITRCGLELRRAVDAKSLELFTVFVVSFHPNFVTMSDRAFAVHCVFQQQEVTVGHKFNFISDISTREVLSGTADIPVPLLTVVTGRTPDPTHSPATTVFVGDPLTFIWHLKQKSEIYGLRVKDCMAETLDGRKMKVIEDGCSSDDVIMSNVKYAENHNSAFADAMSFKFADAEDVWIKCSVDLCIRRQPHLNATSDTLQEHFCPDTVECHKRAKRSVEELMSSNLQSTDNSFILTSKLNVNERHFVDGNTSRSYESLINETKNGGSWLHSQFCMVKSVLSVGVALVVTLHLAIIAATVLTFCAIKRSKNARMISSS